MSDRTDTNVTPEVPEKAKRRQFSAAYKLRVLAEADQCSGAGQLGEMLRREGLYSSHLTTWRKQRDEGALEGLTPKPRDEPERRREAPSDGCSNMISFHPVLPQIAVHLGNKVRVFDLETGAKIDELTQAGTVHSLAWDPFGTRMAVITEEDQCVHIWNLAQRQVVQVLEGLPVGTFAAFDPSGTLLATTGWDQVNRIWHWQSGELLLKTENAALTVHFSRDGRFLGPSFQQLKAGYWEVQSSPEHRMLMREMATNKGFYKEAEISPDGRLLFVSMDGGVGVWDLTYGRELAGFAASEGLNWIAMDPTGAVLTGWPKIYRWPIRQDADSPDLIHLGPPELVASTRGEIACSHDGKVLAIQQRDGAMVVHCDRPDRPVALRPHDDCRYVAVSPDGKLVATGSHFYESLKVWNGDDGTLLKQLLPAHERIRPVFSPDDRWLFGTCQ